MGEAAKIAGDGGAASRDGGAGDARAVCRRGREARSPAQHTVARRRVRARRASTVTSPLSASRADAEQLPAAAQQVRERRAGVGGRRRRGGAGAARAQEGRAAAEGHALVGAPAPAARRAAALRHGAAPRARAAARRLTPACRLPPALPPAADHISLTFHYRDGRSIIDLLFICSGAPLRRASPCSSRRLRVSRKLRLR